jgi:hypothetical protein
MPRFEPQGRATSRPSGEDRAVEASAKAQAAESNGRLTLQDDRPFRPPTVMLAAPTERYSNIAVDKILDASEAAVRMISLRGHHA